jgi:hypothetical protein
MGHPAPKIGEHWTYANHKTRPDDERWELIDGVAYAMSAPTTRHQRLLHELDGLFYQYFKGKPCKVFRRRLMSTGRPLAISHWKKLIRLPNPICWWSVKKPKFWNRAFGVRRTLLLKSCHHRRPKKI